MKQSIRTGALIAATAAAMALSGVAFADTASATADDSVHCYGINSCKGQGSCKTAENACKGQNVCKGHGFLPTKAAECSAKGGKALPPDAK
jgi:hypothetical protein